MIEQNSANIGAETTAVLPELQEYAKRRWGYTLSRVRFSGQSAELPNVTADYYLDRHGRVGKPKQGPGPYLPVVFQPTATQSRSRLDRQWLQVGGQLAEDMRRRGLACSLALPPQIRDMRPWHWAGFRTDVLYTYCSALPYDEALMLPQVRRLIRKAVEQGFTCERVSRLEDVQTCLLATERRKRFAHRVAIEDLYMLQRALGDDAFRAYLCRSADGRAVSASIELLQPDGRAVGWLAGTQAEFLGTGAAQLLQLHVLQDLLAAGATEYDWGGANHPSVAAAKAQWGGTLVTFHRLQGDGWLDLARHARRLWRFRRAA